MSKELDELEELGNIDLGDNPYKTFERNKLKNVYNKEFTAIKQVLQRLEEIDNANPSEAMKWLEQIIEYITEDKKVKYKSTILFDCEIIKDALIKAQEQEKVLKIIFEKNVDVFRLKKLDFQTFNQLQRSCKLEELTEEEFDLLKRWVECLKN